MQSDLLLQKMIVAVLETKGWKKYSLAQRIWRREEWIVNETLKLGASVGIITGFHFTQVNTPVGDFLPSNSYKFVHKEGTIIYNNHSTEIVNRFDCGASVEVLSESRELFIVTGEIKATNTETIAHADNRANLKLILITGQ